VSSKVAWSGVLSLSGPPALLVLGRVGSHEATGTLLLTVYFYVYFYFLYWITQTCEIVLLQ
jgi:hypothetical protein